MRPLTPVPASNTEPVVRVIAEAASDARARAIAEGVLAQVAGWIGEAPDG